MGDDTPFLGSPTGTMTILWHELESRFNFTRKPLSAQREGVTIYIGTMSHSESKVAVKVRTYPSDDNEARVLHADFANEHKIVSSLQPHPNIVRHVLFIDSTMKNVVVTDLCDTDLLKYVNSFTGGLPELLYRRFFRQLIGAVAYLHRNCVRHSDIKLDNIFVKPDLMSVYLGDFEYAYTFTPGTRVRDNKGSLFYAPPEQLTPGRPLFFPEPADIWSCGVVLYAMIFGMLPFLDPRDNASTTLEFTRQRILQAYYEPYPNHCNGKQIHPECMKIVSGILVKEALFRPSAKNLTTNQWLSTPDISPRPSYEELSIVAN